MFIIIAINVPIPMFCLYFLDFRVFPVKNSLLTCSMIMASFMCHFFLIVLSFPYRFHLSYSFTFVMGCNICNTSCSIVICGLLDQNLVVHVFCEA